MLDLALQCQVSVPMERRHSPFSRSVRMLAALGLAALFASTPASAQRYRTLTPEAGTATSGARRVALVIGNAAYTHATPLRNAANDATDMAAALRRVGFTVVSGTDLSHESMDRALAEFSASLPAGLRRPPSSTPATVSRWPARTTSSRPTPTSSSAAQVRYRALALGAVMEALAESGARFKLVVLDACRNDPFRGWRSAGGGGWAATQGPSGTMIAYGTAPGAPASDNPTGRNGLFTQALLAELGTPGVEASRLMRVVGQRVRQESGGEQEPWVSASYDGDFYFVPGEGDVASAPSSRPPPGAVAVAERPFDGTAEPGNNCRVVCRGGSRCQRGGVHPSDLGGCVPAAATGRRGWTPGGPTMDGLPVLSGNWRSSGLGRGRPLVQACCRAGARERAGSTRLYVQ